MATSSTTPTARPRPPLSSSTSSSLTSSKGTTCSSEDESTTESVDVTSQLNTLTVEGPQETSEQEEKSDDSAESQPLVLHDLSTPPPKKTGRSKRLKSFIEKPVKTTNDSRRLSKRASVSKPKAVATSHVHVSMTIALFYWHVMIYLFTQTQTSQASLTSQTTMLADIQKQLKHVSTTLMSSVWEVSFPFSSTYMCINRRIKL